MVNLLERRLNERAMGIFHSNLGPGDVERYDRERAKAEEDFNKKLELARKEGKERKEQ